MHDVCFSFDPKESEFDTRLLSTVDNDVQARRPSPSGP